MEDRRWDEGAGSGSWGPCVRRGAWPAQSVERATLDLRAVRSGPTVGIEMT